MRQAIADVFLALPENIIISDISSLRNRVLWTIFPSIPGAINTWVGGDVAAAILDKEYVLPDCAPSYELRYIYIAPVPAIGDGGALTQSSLTLHSFSSVSG